MALHEDDKVFKFGDFKGKTYTQVVTDNPEYLAKVKQEFAGKKSTPKYIAEFVEWADGTLKDTKMPMRTRKGAPEKLKQERPCEGGCEKFSRAGTIAYAIAVTRITCGHGHKEKKEDKPKYCVDVCAHDDIDRRGSTRKFIMMYCKGCQTHVDMRDRVQTEQFDLVRAKLQIATPDQQRLVT